MKVIILAGGLGTRISEETHIKPKPMIEIGEKPILWHIIEWYSSFGFNEFIICLGYKSHIIKEYFSNYFLYHSDLTFDFQQGDKFIIHQHTAKPWKITLVETGLNTMTGGRIKRVQKYIGDEPFMMTYGDGVSNVNVKELVKYHHSHGKLATVTTIQPQGHFGVLSLSSDQKVEKFQEKVKGDGGWVNGGFFVLQPDIFNYLTNDDQTVFEKEPLENLAKDGQLMAFKHNGFWHPMDTLRDKRYLNDLWATGNAPWKPKDE